MASGRLGAVDLSSATHTLVYTVPSSTLSVVNISVCNRNKASVKVRVSHLNGALGTLSEEDYIEYDTVIQPNSVLERTGVAMAATHTIVAYSDTNKVSVQVHGIERAV